MLKQSDIISFGRIDLPAFIKKCGYRGPSGSQRIIVCITILLILVIDMISRINSKKIPLCRCELRLCNFASLREKPVTFRKSPMETPA